MKFYFLFCAFLIHSSLSSQDGNIFIQGKVVDNTNQPLPSASVRLNSKGIGTITNASGQFSIKLPITALNDTLLVSFVGYTQKRIGIAAIKFQEMLVVKLDQKPEALQEVIIRSLNPAELIRTAIARIPENYYSKPHISKGFYRIDTKKGDEHIMLSEAVFDIYNYGYNSKKENAFRLLKVRDMQDENASHGLDLGLSPQGLYEFDIIKDIQGSGLLNSKTIKKHQFKLTRKVLYHGSEAYEISFDQKPGLKESLYKGKLYLEVNSLAFIAFDFSRSPNGIAYAKYGNAATRALIKLMGLDVDLKKDDNVITYQKHGDKWMLASVRNDNILHFKNNRQYYDFPADIRVDYIITGIDTSGIIEFSQKELLEKKKLIEFQDALLDKDFWKDYNIILADYNSDEIAKQIKAKNDFFNLKKQVESNLKKFPKDKSARIDSIFNFYFQKGSFNGSVLIKAGGKIILNKGYGFANQETKSIATDTTQYRIGSLTKSFTSLLIHQLISKNKISLNDSVSKFLPQYIHKHVLIEQLLSHTSGIPNLTNNTDALVAVMANDYKLPDIVSRFCSEPLEFNSGEQFRYSNSGYLVLAAIIETGYNKEYARVLMENIFTPLQMHHSSFADSSINSRGYWLGMQEPVYKIKNLAGAGGIISTVNDLLKWDESFYTNKLLSQESIHELFEPRASYNDWDAYYGYGWMIDRKLFKQSKDHKIIYHPGTDFGYYTMFVRQPDSNNLIIMLSNTGDFPRFDLTDLILDVLN